VTRTTIDIDAPVLQELKERQRREGKTLGALASELLARALAEEETPSRSVTWHTQDMGDPAVDLDDKDALWAVLDRP
jgi:hypothetical protein